MYVGSAGRVSWGGCAGAVMLLAAGLVGTMGGVRAAAGQERPAEVPVFRVVDLGSFSASVEEESLVTAMRPEGSDQAGRSIRAGLSMVPRETPQVTQLRMTVNRWREGAVVRISPVNVEPRDKPESSDMPGPWELPVRLILSEGRLARVEERIRPNQRDVLVWVQPEATWDDLTRGTNLMIPVGERIRQDIEVGPPGAFPDQTETQVRSRRVHRDAARIVGMEDSVAGDVVVEHRVTDERYRSGGQPWSRVNFVRHRGADGMRPDRVVTADLVSGDTFVKTAQSDYRWRASGGRAADELVLDRVVRTVFGQMGTGGESSSMPIRRTTIRVTDDVGLTGQALATAVRAPAAEATTPVRKREDAASRAEAYRAWQVRQAAASETGASPLASIRNPGSPSRTGSSSQWGGWWWAGGVAAVGVMAAAVWIWRRGARRRVAE